MTGQVRYTVIKALEGDLQQRFGRLYLSTDPETDERGYAVEFDTRILGDRREDVTEHYIFDGRWFVEKLHEERQFNKRELVPSGETLDPMELMREAPFWVSLGRDTDRIRERYDLERTHGGDWLSQQPDYDELKYLAHLVEDHTQLVLTPKPGSPHEDDWESVRIWYHPETLVPRLYVKLEWTGDIQIVELFKTETNTHIDPSVFDTTTPPPESGWRVQIAPWRGDPDKQQQLKDAVTKDEG